jgi:multicomponent Na+:H+ antiporter subunit C
MIYALSAIALFGIGAFGLFAHGHLVRKILAANIMGSGVLLVLVASAHRTPHATADPVPHALVLTGIVVSVSATATGLALARRLARAGTDARASEE